MPEDLKSEENKKYDWTQVYTFDYDEKAKLKNPFNAVVQHLDDPDSLPQDMFMIEDNLIDMDMQQLSGEEANRLYNEIKARAIRVHRKKMGELKIKKVLDEEEFIGDEGFTLVGDRDSMSSGSDATGFKER